MAESEEELMILLMKVKEESGKVGLKLSIQKTKITASGPITSWEINGETVETVSDFILSGSKITADGECSHEIKRRLLLGRKTFLYYRFFKKIPPFISEMSQVTEIQRFIKFSSWQTKNVLVKIKPLCLSISQNVHTE